MRKPAEYRSLLVRGAKYPDKWYILTYSKERGYFEPITNRDAVPVIGMIVEWKYRYDANGNDLARNIR